MKYSNETKRKKAQTFLKGRQIVISWPLTTMLDRAALYGNTEGASALHLNLKPFLHSSGYGSVTFFIHFCNV